MKTTPRISGAWRTSLAAVIWLAMTAVVFAQKVTVDSNPAAPFSAYKTYAWLNGTPAPEPIMEQQLRASINERLMARGLTKTTVSPDLLVMTNVTTQQRQEFVPNGFAYGPWWWGAYGYGPGYMDTWLEGTLVVDFYDAKTKQLVWRGVATANASDKPTHNVEKMDKALKKMFEKFPIGVAVN